MTPTPKSGTTALPTERLTIEWPEGIEFTDETEEAFNAMALDRIHLKAAELRDAGERQRFEVWYVGVPGREDSGPENFDAVEVADDDTVMTLPPYVEMLGEG